MGTGDFWESLYIPFLFCLFFYEFETFRFKPVPDLAVSPPWYWNILCLEAEKRGNHYYSPDTNSEAFSSELPARIYRRNRGTTLW